MLNAQHAIHWITAGVIFALCFSSVSCTQPLTSTARPAAFWVYVGTYNGPKSHGVYVSRFDMTSGKLGEPELAADLPKSPTFLAVHPNGKFIYTADEIDKNGGVSALSISADTGKLTLLNQYVIPGTGPCHVMVDPSGRNVLTANYDSGVVEVIPIGDDGKLTKPSAVDKHSGPVADAKLQVSPRRHCINLSPDNRFALSCDLGLDKVIVYKFDPIKGTITPNDPPSAPLARVAGPRHLTFSPNGKFVYVINELNSTITAFTYDAQKGALAEFQTISTLPADFKGASTTAEIAVHPSGKFLYGSNRGHDSIAIFTIDPATGKLTAAGHQSTQGKTPRNFELDPSGAFLIAANQNSDSVVVFAIDANTGGLKPTGSTIMVGAPVSLKFVPIK